MPCNNAKTERCFSAMNFIHNYLRNALKEIKVNDLLMIYLNGVEWKNYNVIELYNYLKKKLRFI